MNHPLNIWEGYSCLFWARNIPLLRITDPGTLLIQETGSQRQDWDLIVRLDQINLHTVHWSTSQQSTMTVAGCCQYNSNIVLSQVCSANSPIRWRREEGEGREELPGGHHWPDWNFPLSVVRPMAKLKLQNIKQNMFRTNKNWSGVWWCVPPLAWPTGTLYVEWRVVILPLPPSHWRNTPCL